MKIDKVTKENEKKYPKSKDKKEKDEFVICGEMKVTRPKEIEKKRKDK